MTPTVICYLSVCLLWCRISGEGIVVRAKVQSLLSSYLKCVVECFCYLPLFYEDLQVCLCPRFFFIKDLHKDLTLYIALALAVFMERHSVALHKYAEQRSDRFLLFNSRLIFLVSLSAL